MEETNPHFPLFNRLVVLTLSSAVLLGMLAQLAIPAVRNRLDLASSFLLVVFVGMSCWGIWVSVRWPSRRLEDRDLAPHFECSRLPDNAIVCQFFTGVRSGSVVIEPDAAVIHFDHCHVPNTFLALSQPMFHCALSEIQDTITCRAPAVSLTIRTALGKAVIPGHATNYDQLVEFLQRTVPVRTVATGTDHPLMGYVYVAGALAGLFGGVYLTPRNAADSVLGIFVIVGAFLGILASRALVVLADRYLRIGIAPPIAYGLIGLIAGLTVALSTAPYLGWNLVLIIAWATAGTLLGVLWGCRSTSSS